MNSWHIAKERALAKDKVERARPDRGPHPVSVAAGANQSDEPGRRGVGSYQLADLRAHPIGTDHEPAGRRGAVGEPRDYAAVRRIDGDKALAILDANAAADRFIMQDLIQIGAPDGQGPRSVRQRQTARCRPGAVAICRGRKSAPLTSGAAARYASPGAMFTDPAPRG